MADQRLELVIRNAKLVDIPPICAFLDGNRAGSIYEGLDLRPTCFKPWLRALMMHADSWVSVVDRGGEIHGVLIGTCVPVLGGPAKMATDAMFVTDEVGRGGGAIMMRRFIRWAKRVPGVARIWLQNASGLDASRTNKLYESLGLDLAGSIYCMELPK